MKSKLLSIIGAGILGGLVAVTPVRAEEMSLGEKIMRAADIESCGDNLSCYDNKLSSLEALRDECSTKYIEANRLYQQSPSEELEAQITKYDMFRQMAVEGYDSVSIARDLVKSNNMLDEMGGSEPKDVSWPEWPGVDGKGE